MGAAWLWCGAQVEIMHMRHKLDEDTQLVGAQGRLGEGPCAVQQQRPALLVAAYLHMSFNGI